LSPILKNPDRYISVSGQKALQLLITPPKGVLALSAHLGNWDLLAAYLVKKGSPCATIGRITKNACFQKVMSDLRERYGIKTIWRSDKAGLKEMLAGLTKKRMIGALIDQDTSRVSNTISRFFGKPASSPIAMINMAKRYNCLVVACFLVRTALNRYTFYCSELDSTKSSEEILQEYNNTLEGLIRQYPGQWVWFHRRWRTLAEGRLSSKAYLAYLKNNMSQEGLRTGEIMFC
jgi:Kdo2-lipid IVA lauroyltransferase/acyltransferase